MGDQFYPLSFLVMKAHLPEEAGGMLCQDDGSDEYGRLIGYMMAWLHLHANEDNR